MERPPGARNLHAQVVDPVARDAHREGHLWRDPLRGWLCEKKGLWKSAAAPLALHGLGLKPSPWLEFASGLLLRPTIRRNLARWRTPSHGVSRPSLRSPRNLEPADQ